MRLLRSRAEARWHISCYLDTFTYTYNEAGWPKSVSSFVDNVEYTPRGQIELIEFSNGTTSEREYYDTTFRLERIFTSVNSIADQQDLAHVGDVAVLFALSAWKCAAGGQVGWPLL